MMLYESSCFPSKSSYCVPQARFAFSISYEPQTRSWFQWCTLGGRELPIDVVATRPKLGETSNAFAGNSRRVVSPGQCLDNRLVELYIGSNQTPVGSCAVEVHGGR